MEENKVEKSGDSLPTKSSNDKKVAGKGVTSAFPPSFSLQPHGKKNNASLKISLPIHSDENVDPNRGTVSRL